MTYKTGTLPSGSQSGPYRRIFAYLRPYRGTFALALICMVLFGATDGIVPFIVKYVLDGVFSRQDRYLLYALPIGLVTFSVLRALFDFGQQYMMAKVGHNIVRDIRQRVNDHLLTLSPDFFLRHSAASIISRITSDVTLVKNLLTDSLAAILRDSIRIVALLASAIYLDPFLALIAFVAFPLGVFPVYRFGRKMRRLSKKGQEAVGGLGSIMQETIIGHRVVKIFGRESYESERFRKENENLNSTFLRSERIRAITGPINEVLASLAISGVILYGGWSVIGGTRSQGDFIAFLLAVFLLYDPFKKLSRVNSVVQQGLSGAERIFEILDTVPTVRDPEQPVPLGKGSSIELRDISFSYPGAESGALSDINLTIDEGKKVALVGFSGSGKSTLVDLIARFIDPERGIVTIGGVDISRVLLSELRGRIAMVGQHTFLFNDTIMNNIRYGNADATPEMVEAASRAAFAHEFIMRLPNGYETVVGEGGMSLSGGERQRIAIARAILKNAPILILDEATASLDNRSEREVQSAIKGLEEGRTSVVIAHRLSTVRDADRIVVLREGKIVEQGAHDELLAAGGEYSKLYALQFAESGPGDAGDELVVN